MTNHTGTVRACQYHVHPPTGETTPAPPSTPSEAPPSTPSDSIDRRLVQRYGLALLTGGYTALPTYAWVYYARLGVSEAEMVLIAQLCTYWWSARAPYPGEAALAARMGKTVRTIQGYLRSLEGKGLLHIQIQFSQNGQQHTNAYDLRPFFATVEGLARLDGLLSADGSAAALATTTTPDSASPHRTPTIRDNDVCAERPWDASNGPHRDAETIRDNDVCAERPWDASNGPHRDAERKSLCAETRSAGPHITATNDGLAATRGGEESIAGRVKNLSPQVNPIEIKNFDLDSIPPTPTHVTQIATNDLAGPATNADSGDQGLAAVIADLSGEMGDDALRSSLGRAHNLYRAAGVSPERFLRLLDEAATRTRDRQAGIVKRRRDGLAVNGMPYLFAVLTDLLHPAPAQPADVDSDAARRRVGPPGRRRRRRDDGRSEPVSSYAAWSDSPDRLPIVEEHPVWRAALDELATAMTTENFNTWLAPTHALDQDGVLLRVAVPAPFHQQWLDQRLRGTIERAVARIDTEVRVEFVVAVAA